MGNEILRIEITLPEGAYFVYFTQGSVETIRIQSRGEFGVIHMKSGQEYPTTRDVCEAVLEWMGFPAKESLI